MRNSGVSNYFKDMDHIIIGFAVFAICVGSYAILGIKNIQQEKLQYENIVKNSLIKKGYTNIKILKHISVNINHKEGTLEGCITAQYSNILQNEQDDFTVKSYKYNIDNGHAKIASILACDSSVF